MTHSLLAGHNNNSVKAHNVRAILQHILQQEQITRVQLARRTSLSNTTITNLIAELLDQGLVAEEGTESNNGRRGVGRPRTVLRLVPDARFAVGVHIGIGTLRAAVTNLHAEIVRNNIASYPPGEPAATVLDQIAALVEQTLAESGVGPEAVVGLGIGASGLVDYHSGVNLRAPRLGWRNVPIRDWMSQRLNLPVTVDNNVRAMALGEALFGAGRGVNSLAFVYGRIGVGAGFVVNGQLFRGSGAGAGEIGHTVMIAEGGALCHCGQRGCLETLVSESVLIQEAEQFSREFPEGILARSLAQPEGKPIERIFAAARAGDPHVRRLVENRARYLGMALANLVNVLNPELIILGGMFTDGHDLILPVAEATMRERAFAGLGEHVRVQATRFGWRAGVIGAASLGLSTFFYQSQSA